MITGLWALSIILHLTIRDGCVIKDVERDVAASSLPVLGSIQATLAVQDTCFGELDINGWN